MKVIWLIGCGRMGSAMLTGWVKNLPEAQFVIIDHNAAELAQRFSQKNVACFESIDQALAQYDQANAMIFAIKPYHIEELLKQYGEKLHQMHPLFMTVVTGKPMAFYEQYLGQDSRIIRTMPNTPGAIGKGITAAVPNRAVKDSDLALGQILFQPLGEFLWKETDLDLDKVTAISGSGPAYVFLFMEAMVDKAVALGFSQAEAKKLVIETVLGAAEYAKVSEDSITQLRLNVTSPKGTTEKAIEVFENQQANLRQLVDDALEACYRRSIELGGAS